MKAHAKTDDIASLDRSAEGRDVAESHFFPGQLLLRGRLRIENRVGYGSMGIVYKARDTLLGRDIALKTLRSFDASRLQQLKTEFRTLTGFSHPNLVQLYELTTIDDTWLLLMELVHGVDLRVWLEQKPARGR